MEQEVLELVDWIGRAGVIQAAQAGVRAREPIGGAQALLHRARRAELVRRIDQPFPTHPALHLATAAGLRACGLDHLGPAQAHGPGLVHALGCVWLGLELEAEHGSDCVRYERELRAGPGAWALVRLGGVPGGGESQPAESHPTQSPPPGSRRAASHRPDLVLVTGVRRFAVELELSPKAPKRLEAILSAYAAAPQLDGVRYYAPDAGVRRQVSAAARRVGADGLVEVVAWAPPGPAPAPFPATSPAPGAP